MSATKCYRCGLPFFGGVMGFAVPQCQCFINHRPAPDAAETLLPAGCHPARQLTEADVRRIVREELARADKAQGGGHG